ncbi:hypothetical protein PIIN_06961 [Serendipita indica DSM 11827]|uniref:MYND-type domain-containing protein n=1 Tax=Serendipita indica (strain DSM 11827) TaxID=1109443 RepID=G4TNW3_SERID|nr:hypothetical protein PIIN_06961 [Serendipita indica DSM 11827]
MITQEGNFTIPLLIYYWKLAPNLVSRRQLEFAIARVALPRHDLTKPEPYMRHKTLRRLFQFIELEFGKKPGPVVVKLLLRGLGEDSDEPSEKAELLICTGMVLSVLGLELVSPPEVAQASLIRALARSAIFWKRYFASVMEQRKDPQKSSTVLLSKDVEPLYQLLYTASQLDPECGGQLASKMIRGQLLQYLEYIMVECQPDDSTNDVIDAILNELGYVLASTRSGIRYAMGVEVPRTRLMHALLQPYLSVPVIKQIIHSPFILSKRSFKDFPFDVLNLQRTEDVQIWASLLAIQDATVHYRRCTRRGCKELAKQACARCATRYCSRGLERTQALVRDSTGDTSH